MDLKNCVVLYEGKVIDPARITVIDSRGRIATTVTRVVIEVKADKVRILDVTELDDAIGG